MASITQGYLSTQNPDGTILTNVYEVTNGNAQDPATLLNPGISKLVKTRTTTLDAAGKITSITETPAIGGKEKTFSIEASNGNVTSITNYYSFGGHTQEFTVNRNLAAATKHVVFSGGAFATHVFPENKAGAAPAQTQGAAGNFNNFFNHKNNNPAVQEADSRQFYSADISGNAIIGFAQGKQHITGGTAQVTNLARLNDRSDKNGTPIQALADQNEALIIRAQSNEMQANNILRTQTAEVAKAKGGVQPGVAPGQIPSAKAPQQAPGGTLPGGYVVPGNTVGSGNYRK